MSAALLDDIHHQCRRCYGYIDRHYWCLCELQTMHLKTRSIVVREVADVYFYVSVWGRYGETTTSGPQ